MNPLELDLQKIARARKRNFAQRSAMNYLLSPIRRELEQRIDEATEQFADGLIIDFENGDLSPKNIVNKQYCSLLESPLPVLDIPATDMSVDRLAQYPDQSFDYLVVNLHISWLDFAQLITQLRRLLRPQGVLYFSAFGPDTLGEVYNGWAQVDTLPHVHPFVDMHHLGDGLLHSGFIEPIVDTDWIYVDYPSIELLFEDLKQEGFTNIHSQRRKTLTGKQRFSRFKKALNAQFDNAHNINITFEVIYGFARNPPQSDGSIRVMPPRLD